MKIFENVAQLKLARLGTGQIVKTKGYYTANDGGGAEYIIVATGTGTDDGGSFHNLSNTNQAQLITNGELHASHYGVLGGVGNVGPQIIQAATVAHSLRVPLILPSSTVASPIESSITLDFSGLAFLEIEGQGVDSTYISITADVKGMRFLGRRCQKFSINGIGALATQDGIEIDQNQRHNIQDIKVTLFNVGIRFKDGNLSYLNNIFCRSNNSHGFVCASTDPDSNSITVGQIDCILNGGDGFHIETGSGANASDNWFGGIISVQQNTGKGYNISGRGHSLIFYDELNSQSELDSLSEASQIRVLFGSEPLDNGTNNEVILHRVDAAEAITHLKSEIKDLTVRDRGLTGQFQQNMDRNNVLRIAEAGSGGASLVEILSELGPSCGLSVGGRINSQIITNNNLSALLTVTGGNVINVTNSAPTTITSFVSSSGQTFTLIFLDGNTTIQNAVNVQLAGGVNFTPTVNSTITFVSNGTQIYEVSRSVN